MKRKSSLILLMPLLNWLFLAPVAKGQSPAASPAVQGQAVHVQTALDHITVLEFAEPVLQAAAGSPAFNIEFRDSKVLIKPLKVGAATDLFVWTASRRFAYELDPPGEVKNMTIALDTSAPKPVETKDEAMTLVADMALTHALMGSQRIDNHSIKNQKGRVVVRIEAVYESTNSTYIRYVIKNLGDHPYRVVTPAVHRLAAHDPGVSLVSLERTQLDANTLKKLAVKERLPLAVASAQLRAEDLSPGTETYGVVVLRQRFPASAVLELAFPNSGDQHVSAIFVH